MRQRDKLAESLLPSLLPTEPTFFLPEPAAPPLFEDEDLKLRELQDEEFKKKEERKKARMRQAAANIRAKNAARSVRKVKAPRLGSSNGGSVCICGDRSCRIGPFRRL